MEAIKEDVYVRHTILEDLENLNSFDEDSNEYKELYKKIINVGEFKNYH